MSLKEVGWTPVSICLWLDRSGHEVKIFDLSPRHIQMMVEKDVQIKLWEDLGNRNEKYKNLGGKPWLAPVQSMLRCRDSPA